MSTKRSANISHKSDPDPDFDPGFPGPVCGLDEVGRGPLAGPVVAACVHIPESAQDLPFWQEVKDSKKLSPKARDRLFDLIRAHASYGIAECSVAEIDRMNILQASLHAMTRAYAAMTTRRESSFPRRRESFSAMPPEDPRFHGDDNNVLISAPRMATALIDGNQSPKDLPCPTQCIVKGDSKSRSIAAASILAKVTRDRLMITLAKDYPAYGWEKNMGYPAPAHLEALRLHGPTPHHRTSFAPIKHALADRGKR